MEIQPLLTEVEAARKLGVAPRSLRSERTAGRITFRRVAGKIMYRADDLNQWQENIAICHARPKAQRSAQTRSVGAHTTSITANRASGAAAAIAQAQAIKERLLSISDDGSKGKAESSGPAPVVPLKR